MRRVPVRRPGDKVVDIGSGGGFDSFIAAAQVSPGGKVIGIGMTAEMLAKSHQIAEALGLGHVQFPMDSPKPFRSRTPGRMW